ncbi:MAG: molybdopterin-dependent oxidoreductase [Microbacteriaceae bacterium]
MKYEVNGEEVEVHPAPGRVLRTVLRDTGHFEVRKGCDAGDCGACTVLVNSEPVHSCIYPAHRLEGAKVTTVSGLGTPEHLHPVQQNFAAAGAFQCGFCTAGLIVTASTFTDGVTGTVSPEVEAELPRLLKGNLCRCTGYRSIGDALCGVSNTETASAGEAAGRSIAPPAATRVVTGSEPYTLDLPTTAVLHLAILGSPHPHARITRICVDAAAELPGVHAVLTHLDSPSVHFSTGRHEHRTDDPDDTLVLDPVLRFRGQRVAAVVADSVAIAERALELIDVDYDVLDAVFDPEIARSPGAPLVHGDKVGQGETTRIADVGSNTVAELHGESGDVDSALSASAAVVSGTWHTPRVSHAALETHATRGWLDEDGRLVIRTSSQVPFLVRDELCHIFDLEPQKVRVFTARVGGGFGGKQELLTEDLVTLAVLATGRPVQYEFTRRDEFTIAPTRHPMRVSVTLGADADGILTAIAVDELANAGAYGNHSIGVMFHSVSESISVYRCANKRVDAQSVYTNTLPSGAFRGYGLGQVIFAVESAMDELARVLDIDPFELRRRNVIVPGDSIHTVDAEEENDFLYSSYGLDQCLDLAEKALAVAHEGALEAPHGDFWSCGEGMALAMIASLPPRGHFAQASVSLRADGGFDARVGTSDFGSGTTTVHAQIVATALGTTVDTVHVAQSDTDLVGYDTGAFGSAGVVVAGAALLQASEALRDAIQDRITELALHSGEGGKEAASTSELLSAGPLIGHGSNDGTPRTVAFNVHAFRVAVNTQTGEVRILRSIQTADAGTVLNPAQLRGQIEGGTAQAIGSALYEEMVLDGDGRVTTDAFRSYHIPQFADIPHTEVLFADTRDTLGPLGAKSMSEAPYNPVAPALANAIRDAIGKRPHELPMSRDRLWRLINDL